MAEPKKSKAKEPPKPSPLAEPEKGTPTYYEHRILSARSKLLMKKPFFGFLAMALPVKLDDDIRTAATDGSGIVFARPFIDKLSDDQMQFIFAHEVMHCALEHLWRGNGKTDKRLWNICTDRVINDMLVEDGFVKWEDGLFGAGGKSAEELYEEEKRKGKSGGGNGKSGDQPLDNHDGWYNQDPNSVENRIARDRFNSQVKEAARNYGKDSKAARSLLREIDKAEKVDWRVLLLSVLTYQQDDYTWTPVDRRLLQSGILLPTLRSEEIRVVVVLDTSGSVEDDLLSQFWAETASILKMNGVKARIMTCDTEIGDEWTELEFDPKNAKVENRGGTSFVKPFERLQKLRDEGWNATLIVYLTDLDGLFPTHAPFNVRVVWAVPEKNSKTVPPFGEVLVID